MIGRTLGNRYNIIEKVGTGGMAYVYKAEDKILKRLVAIKVLKEQFIEDQEFSKKFEIEAQSAARLSHPNIVNVYDVGTDRIDDRIIHYIVMEYINGRTLKDLIREKGKLSTTEAVSYSKQIASALDLAHRNGIIHRDIKPQNIMINDEGMVKVTDFGIARISSSATITYTSSILGTVHYISPEQAKGSFIDYKSDIYSLGIVMYEMLTGRVPFDAENSVGIALAHIHEKVEAPRILNPSISPRLNSIVLKALEKNPENRFSSCRELIRALNSRDIFSDISNRAVYNPNSKKKDQEKKVAIYKTDHQQERADKKNQKNKKNVFLKILASLIIISILFFVARGLSNTFKKNEVEIPSVVNKSEAEALALILNSNLKYSIKRVYSDKVDKGYVISQSPNGGEMATKGSLVEIQISDGVETVKMPSIKGQTLQSAKAILEPLGLSIETERYEFNDSIEEGKIISQHPEANEEVSTNSQIEVTLSKGKEVKTVKMPNLLGSSEQAALKTIEDMKLKNGDLEKRYSDEYPEGTVMWQSYDQGTELKEGTAIDILISKGKSKNNITGIPSGAINLAEDENNTEQVKIFSMQIEPPTDRENFKVKIIRIYNGNEKEVYNKAHNSKDGSFTIDFVDYSSSKFKIFFDDELVHEN
ncbi:Stk1 family PASTA domain-containing Ser/Thr kinase [Citroniella saccharovorans]|uniref:non-specific serine/threonine protein kinase n=1 Tax=Citroniella saccharovorans TaxID=2053367 RepID=A0AAW9MUI5_9FIRM|nr:Stk1 family PASTA domain-containing Ser/Thr kinase [Citroniella saccharovorans]MEB3429513.1 Stk1 family PASTA domain-containing Ser/Thr kinase [Citroniella saccharovorans]